MTDTKAPKATDDYMLIDMADSLTAATAAGVAVLVKHYGAGTDRAAVTLARQARSVVLGITKAPHNGNGTKVRAVVKAVDALDSPDATAYVHAARVVLDAAKADAKARRDAQAADRAAAKAVANDRAAAKSDRVLAFEDMARIDGLTANAKTDALTARVNALIVTAKSDGLPLTVILDALSVAYGVTFGEVDGADYGVTYPALKSA